MKTVTLMLGLALVAPLGVEAKEIIGQHAAIVEMPQPAQIVQGASPHDGELPVADPAHDRNHGDVRSEAAPHGFGYMLVDPSRWLPHLEKCHV